MYGTSQLQCDLCVLLVLSPSVTSTQPFNTATDNPCRVSKQINTEGKTLLNAGGNLAVTGSSVLAAWDRGFDSPCFKQSGKTCRTPLLNVALCSAS